ncbi:MAG: hypothetical protein ABR612_14425, partial [Chromatocurvus sp.]
MQEHRKRWLTLSVAIASGVSLGTAADTDRTTPLGEYQAALTLAMADEGEGEGAGGEGEGEGEGAARPADLKTDDQAYLGLIRGHLRVGHELHRAGHTDMATTHIKHPRDELYAGLVPALQTRGAATFDDELSMLAERVTSDASPSAVAEAYLALESGITDAETVAGASLKTSLLSIMDLIRTAGEEYALGVE